MDQKILVQTTYVQTTWLIQVLDDSKRRSIEYENRLWLRQNVSRLYLRVYVEDCNVYISQIAKYWSKQDTSLIQDGKRVYLGDNFNPKKEALLIVNLGSEIPDYYVFLYSPKE